MTQRGMFGVSGTGDTSGYGRLVRSSAAVPGSSRPFGGYFDELADHLLRALPAGSVAQLVVDRGELTVHLEPDSIVEAAQVLRDELAFDLCLGVSGVHFPDDAGHEMHAVYHFYAVQKGRRIRLEVGLPEHDPHVRSICSVYPGNDWHERETYDFFGIVFDGHPGLTRIEMPDDWEGHPQRKDYPLGGVPVEYHGATIAPPDERRSYR